MSPFGFQLDVCQGLSEPGHFVMGVVAGDDGGGEISGACSLGLLECPSMQKQVVPMEGLAKIADELPTSGSELRSFIVK